MTSRQRLLVALNHGTPDRVPVAPDLTMLLPARYSGRPFWDPLLHENPPVWKEVIRLRDRFGFDAFVQVAQDESAEEAARKTTVLLEELEDRVAARTEYRTARGSLTKCVIYPRGDAPWTSEPLLKNPKEDLPKLLELYRDPGGRSGTTIAAVRAALGDNGIVGDYLGVPSFNWCLVRGSIQDAILDYYDDPALMERYTEAYTEYGLAYIENSIAKAKPDYFMFGGSYASMSVISPGFYRDHNLPFVQKATALLKSHGVPSGLHMCGKSAEMIPVFAGETDLQMLEPLERPPSGNVDIGDIKRRFGKRLCLKGNVHTFLTLLKGTRADVERECRACIEAVAEGGGFILASGDQVPRDTPYENLEAMVMSARQYGRYSA